MGGMKDAWKIGMAEIERDELTASPVEQRVSKTFDCRECGTKMGYNNMAAYEIKYKMDKEGTKATGATMEMVCMKCFYKTDC